MRHGDGAPDASDPGPVAGLATIGQRVVALLVDMLVIGVPIIVLVLLTSDINEEGGTISTPVWARLLSTAVGAVYQVVLIKTRGQTVGKRVLQIKVVRMADGQLPDWSASIVRYLVPVLPGLIPLPGVWLLSPVVYLSAAFHPLRQGWHDRVAGTIVVRIGDAADPAPDPPLGPSPL